ncbi:GNAT family N-acetyltransferase [Sinorhizobium prairiense]|uniref:GNAT family N-acetyltransferase n=1 Tax=unclassified Sinorhizobium TaxID=2613772 RepID=UPI0023D84064|nr:MULTISPECIES: GNAT family N-acetyltransferase [unclassified Sinorhizobium]WEJ11136.1 GNAT family N-acetyltransferase [Sinorhizobium sp. M103]WEJ14265.1 GNAT family N-acetyltransferase [Sinorhizobium sp. K101]WEJ38124.1 GNAT family N-acetyltransferase [Sinorhizobium sp. C101]
MMASSDFTLSPEASAGRYLSAGSVAREGSGAGRITISVHADMDEIEAEWRVLDGSSGNSLHQSFDWCAAWTKTHGSELLIVRGAAGREPLFLLPFEIERGRLFRAARLIGSEHSNLNTGLFGPGIDNAPAAELTAALTGGIGRQLRRFADVIVFDRTPQIWRGAPHPLAALAGIENPNASFQLPLLGTIEHTLAQINAKRRRKKMRISERRLAEIGGYDYVIARETQEAHALLETFFRQKAARFETLGLPDAFRDAETRAFFHALIDARAPEPLLELNAIRLRGEYAGRILAVAGLSRKGDHVICQFGSIDEEIAADASPGELLFYRMIERLCTEGVAVFDFGIGDQPYKRSWCTVETPLRDIVLPLTFRGRLAAGGFRAIAGAKRLVKANETLYAFVQRQRQRRQTSAASADEP